jgi:hypothetical protein
MLTLIVKTDDSMRRPHSRLNGTRWEFVSF